MGEQTALRGAPAGQLRAGRPVDPSASPLDFDEILRLHGTALEARALWLTRSASDAADLLQQTLEHALVGSRREVPAARMRSWLYAIMHNAFLDRRRCGSSRRLVPLDGFVAERIAAERIEPEPLWRIVDEALLEDCIQRLPPGMRQVVRLHLEGLSYAEVAVRLGKPIGTVGTRLMRARRRLREMLVADSAIPLDNAGSSVFAARCANDGRPPAVVP
jgi:RNA polymerase sigma-70 factor (ECF subfamily)